MNAQSTGQLDCLAVVADDELHARVRGVLDTWHLRTERVDETVALARTAQGHCRVVLTDRRPGLSLWLQRIRAAGAVPVVLGRPGADVGPDVECVARPAELAAALFRAQGRLLGVETSSAARVRQFAQVIAEQFALPELMKVAIATTRELCEAEGASLLLIEPSTGGLYIDTVEGSGHGLERIQLPRGKGVAGRVAVEGRPSLVEDAQRCPDFDRSADRHSGFTTGSIIAAPLVLAGDVLGVLMAVRSTDALPFSPAHLERLVQLTPHVAIAVHNAQITNALRTSQTQVLQANLDLEKKVQERTQQISRAKQEWERTFDAIDTPIALLDGYVIRRTNLAYARQVGRPVREIPGKKCHEIFANRDSPCPGCPLSRGRGQAPGAELEARERFFRLNGYWLSDDPKDGSVVVTYHDITESRVLAEKLRESERLAAVGQLASGAAHEINNPLAFVTSNLRTLRGLVDELRAPLRSLEDVTQQLDDGVEMIDESLDGARRVGDIVKGLRELSRLEIGKREPSSVKASVTRVVRAELGDGANLTLQLDARLQADVPPLQLDQALSHLLRNAKLATPGREQIIVRSWEEHGQVMLQVEDHGVGIVSENLRRVFEPFFTTRGVGKGIGLGLTAAYGIVKRVGGDIEAKSEGAGKGATFTIRLPRAEVRPVANVA